MKQKEEENKKLKIIIAELEAVKAEHLGTLINELAQKEAKIIELHDLLEEKRVETKVTKEVVTAKDQESFDMNQQLKETKTQLAAKSQLVSDYEQQLKKVLNQMRDDVAIINAKQLKIVEVTEKLELVKVSYYCKYFILILCCSSFKP